MERSSGILMHITSLPSPYGIGTLGKAAYDFADFLKAAGQSYWQILPVGPTGFGDSPYQSFSSFAGNPYMIDFDLLAEDGMLTKEDYCNIDWGSDESHVDFDKQYENRFAVLRKAYDNSYLRTVPKMGRFLKEHESWIYEYALFRALKLHFEGQPWQKWPEDIRMQRPEAMKHYYEELSNDVNFYVFIQYLFYKQWTDLRTYVNKLGISIIGDIPIYAAMDSADTWSNPKVFWLDENNMPVCVAGCPPDYFSPTGQLWGNPLYNWEYLKKTGYKWWINRLSTLMQLFDMVRIDHFRGFEGYYAIPVEHETAEHGKWMKGPGFSFFHSIKGRLGSGLPLIAEDLGFLTPGVEQMLEKTGYPGMKVLQFAFDSDESNAYLPHNYNKNCVAYVGTHDNDTLKGWFTTCGHEKLQKAEYYLNLTNEEGYNFGMIRGIMSSVAALSMVPMQDYLFLDGSCRMNEPSKVGGNWQWRMRAGAVDEQLTGRIYDMTKRFGRLPRVKEPAEQPTAKQEAQADEKGKDA